MNRARSDAGSALIEVVGLGMVVALLMVPILVAAGRLQAGSEAAAEAAESVALTVARGGGVEAGAALAATLLPEADATISVEGADVTVVVRLTVDMIGLPGTLAHTVEGRAKARFSPYASSRG